MTTRKPSVYCIQVRFNTTIQYWDCYSSRTKALAKLKVWYDEGITSKWWTPDNEPDWKGRENGTLFPIGNTPFSFTLYKVHVQ